MINASKDKRIENLFTCGSHRHNLSVIYIVQNLFHQHKPKHPLFGAIQESTRQIAILDSYQANASRVN